MAQIGTSVTYGSVGPSGTRVAGYSNLFAVVQSPWGEDGVVKLCSSFADFTRNFGGLAKMGTLAADGSVTPYTVETTDTAVQSYYNVKGYFDEKDPSVGVAYVVRVCASSSGPTAASHTTADSASALSTFTAKWKGSAGGDVEFLITNPSPLVGTGTAQVTLRHTKASIVEVWQIANSTDASNLSKNSELATLTLSAATAIPSDTAGAYKHLGTVSPPIADPFTATAPDYYGTVGADNSKTGLRTFEDLRFGTGLVITPGAPTIATIWPNVALHCLAMLRFGIVAGAAGKNKSNVAAQVSGITSNYMAFYGNRAWVADQNSTNGGQLLIDPSGHLAGLCARMDSEYQGPHKSPAGTDHPFRTLLDVERQSNGAELYDDAASSTLEDSKVNLLRFKSNAICSWGMRTLAIDSRYAQIPSARTVGLVGLTAALLSQPYTFEPIDSDGKLFSRVQVDMKSFLEELRRHGTLFGDKPGSVPKASDSYSVICDRSNNTDATITAQELHIDLSIVPTLNARAVLVNIQTASPGFVRVSA